MEFLRSRPALNVFFVCLTGLALIFVLHTRGRIFRPEWGIYLLAWAAPALGFWVCKRRDLEEAAVSEVQRGAMVLIFFMVLSFFSSFVLHKWFYFLNWRPQTFPLQSAMATFVLGSISFSIILFWKPALKLTPLLAVLLMGVQLWCFFCLYQKTGGEAIYRDDHPSFIFRLWEFGRTFPHTVNYVPYWNAGVVHCVGVSSGIGAIGIPLLPLWKFTNIFDVYTYAIGFFYIAAMPLIAVFSVRVLGIGWAGSLCAGFLGLGVSRHFFLWLMEYGTVGCLFSSFFILPAGAVLYRIVQADEMNLKTAGLLILSAFFLIQWPPGIIMCAVMGISFLLNFRRWTVKKWLFLAGCGAALFLLDAKPILTILTKGLETVRYVSESNGDKVNFLQVFREGLFYLFAHWQEGHPLLIFLGLGGIFVVPPQMRAWYLPIMTGLAVLTAWGPYWKPHLQLGRTSISLFYICIAPAAYLMDQVLNMRQAKAALFRATIIVLLALGGWNVSRLYANQGIEHYVTLSGEMKDLAGWIRSNTAPDERILFAGSSVHGFGGGHTAALPILAEREMMGCDYYHFPPGTVEYNYPPKLFRSSVEKMNEFLRLYHVGYVVTFREGWKKRLREDMGELFEEKANIGDKTIFKVKETSSSLFLEGKGKVSADFNRIQIHLSRSPEQVVIRYHWQDSLKTSKPVELFPYEVGEGIYFIGIRPKDIQDFEIIYDD